MIRESHRVQRAVERQGYATSRHSGGAFKIDVPDADGSVRGLDVFGGFFTEGHLALLGEIWAPYEREWIFPLGTVTLDGRSLPAPADPERLLAETYGPGWRVPDPAFRYEKDPDVQRRFDEWFRGTRLHRAAWDHRYGLARLLPPYQPPHDISRHLHEREDPEHVGDRRRLRPRARRALAGQAGAPGDRARLLRRGDAVHRGEGGRAGVARGAAHDEPARAAARAVVGGAAAGAVRAAHRAGATPDRLDVALRRGQLLAPGEDGAAGRGSGCTWSS